MFDVAAGASRALPQGGLCLESDFGADRLKGVSEGWEFQFWESGPHGRKDIWEEMRKPNNS